jgi:hypothetical protein
MQLVINFLRALQDCLRANILYAVSVPKSWILAGAQWAAETFERKV